jgi:hypothetical protein
MPYSPTVWIEKATQVGPTNLNKLEQGLQAAALVGDAAQKAPSFSATPPVSPANGDLWILPAGSNGENWMFRYNANSGSAYKWEFVGGTALLNYVSTQEATTTVSAWLNLTTDGPGIVVPRAGDYRAHIVSSCFHSVAQTTMYVAVCRGDTSPADNPYASIAVSNVNLTAALTQDTYLAGVPAGTNLKLRYNMNAAGTGQWSNRTIMVTPVRVS